MSLSIADAAVNSAARLAHHPLRDTGNVGLSARIEPCEESQERMSDHELYELINSPDLTEDAAGADAVRRLYFGLLDMQRGVFNELRLKISHVSSVPDAVRTIDTFALALGFTTVCGATNCAELARKWGKPKETINKPLKEIIEKFKLPKLPGMRSDEAVANMVRARNEQIKDSQNNEN